MSQELRRLIEATLVLERDAELRERGSEIVEAARAERTFVDAVQWSQFAARDGEVHLDVSRLISECARSADQRGCQH